MHVYDVHLATDWPQNVEQAQLQFGLQLQTLRMKLVVQLLAMNPEPCHYHRPAHHIILTVNVRTIAQHTIETRRVSCKEVLKP